MFSRYMSRARFSSVSSACASLPLCAPRLGVLWLPLLCPSPTFAALRNGPSLRWRSYRYGLLPSTEVPRPLVPPTSLSVFCTCVPVPTCLGRALIFCSLVLSDSITRKAPATGFCAVQRRPKHHIDHAHWQRQEEEKGTQATGRCPTTMSDILFQGVSHASPPHTRSLDLRCSMPSGSLLPP